MRNQPDLAASIQPLDATDLMILDALQRDGHLSHAEIGRLVGLAVSSVNERIRKLVQRRVIQGWQVRLAPDRLGLDLLAFVYVLIDRPENSPAFLDLVSQIPEVQECHHVASDWNFLLKVRVKNTAAFEALLTNRLKAVPGVVRTHTVITLSSHKDTPALPLKC
ncbi:Lrp/AsnC family transcriptional regulator [Dongia deserti]|uniref:Lrp/AsnC family transcriptional regulator n=1 Tax=Dongia deserti TaxID=2268030 RepID=UPI0025494757|nr:Lrp/AsnC family transcriptional regulator [Dongia deserti]